LSLVVGFIASRVSRIFTVLVQVPESIPSPLNLNFKRVNVLTSRINIVCLVENQNRIRQLQLQFLSYLSVDHVVVGQEHNVGRSQLGFGFVVRTDAIETTLRHHVLNVKAIFGLGNSFNKSVHDRVEHFFAVVIHRHLHLLSKVKGAARTFYTGQISIQFISRF
jgi:altronate dehydratase